MTTKGIPTGDDSQSRRRVSQLKLGIHFLLSVLGARGARALITYVFFVDCCVLQRSSGHCNYLLEFLLLQSYYDCVLI